MDDGFDRTRTLKVGEIDAHVAEAGAGPDVVLLHGNPDTHTVWSGVVRQLAPRLHCIAPDLPGFGKSTVTRDYDCSLEHQAAFVEGLLDGLELRRAHLVVHDVGGPYGLSFAALHPERIQTLTIFNTSYHRDNRWHFWARVWRTPVLGELAMLIANRPLFVRELLRGSPQMPREYARTAYADFTRATRRHVLRWYRYMDYGKRLPGWDEKLLAATRDVPRQVIWGDKDPFIVGTTADRFGTDRVHRFPDNGHHVMVERPDESARLIEALVAGAGASAAATA